MNEGKYRIPCRKCEYRFVSMSDEEKFCPDCKNEGVDKHTNRFNRMRKSICSNSICYICKSGRPRAVLSVHHINRNKKDDSRDNLAILCRQCHASLHRRYKEPTPINVSVPTSIYYGKFGARWEPKDVITPTEISNQLVSLLLFNKV